MKPGQSVISSINPGPLEFKQTPEETKAAEDVMAQSHDLLQQAMSLFDMQTIQPVQMAFPSVIGGESPMKSTDCAIDVRQMFARQEQLFDGGGIDGQEMDGQEMDGQESPDAAEQSDPEELQAIRAMFESS